MYFGRAGQSIKVPDDPYDNKIADQTADAITSSKAQFEDLHNRLQNLNHHLSSVFRALAQGQGIGEQRHEEVSVMLGEMKSMISTKLDKIDHLSQKLDSLDRDVQGFRKFLHSRIQDSENAVKNHVTDKHAEVKGHVEAHAAPGHTRLILVIVGCQLVLVGAYVMYKRRKTMPKKYL